jgi:hypothetical protein
MFLLGLIAPICFIPGVLGAMIPTQWALFSIVLPLSLWREGAFGPAYWAGLAVLAWSAISLLWVPNGYDGLYGFWLLSICGLAFWMGSTILDFDPLLKGLALGLSVNAAIALAQVFGFQGVPFLERPSGLFYNPTVLSAICALVIIALWSHSLYLWSLGPIAGLIFSGSRGGFFVLGIVLLSRMTRWYIAIPCAIIAIAIMSINPSSTDILRLMNWGITLRQLNLWGHGIGSFTTYFYFNPTEHYPHAIALIHPGFAHNDFLQLWFELGIGALPIYAIYLLCLTRIDSHWHPTFVGLTTLSLFYFPLYCPIIAFLGCIAAGRIVGDWHVARRQCHYGRSIRPLWPAQWQPRFRLPWSQPVPTEP